MIILRESHSSNARGELGFLKVIGGTTHGRFRFLQCSRKSEISDLRLSSELNDLITDFDEPRTCGLVRCVEKNIFRLHISVNEAVIMDESQSFTDLAEDLPDYFLGFEEKMVIDSFSKSHSVDVFHNDIQSSFWLE